MSETNTCQICGRTIKAKSGLIAHHGYKRPQWGWQTASCMGARHLPYEVSCDVLPIAIEKIKAYISRMEISLEDFVNNPPVQLTLPRKSFDRVDANLTRTRPEGFNPARIFSASYRSYESEYQDRRYHMECDIKNAKLHLQFMIERLQNWIKVR